MIRSLLSTLLLLKVLQKCDSFSSGRPRMMSTVRFAAPGGDDTSVSVVTPASGPPSGPPATGNGAETFRPKASGSGGPPRGPSGGAPGQPTMQQKLLEKALELGFSLLYAAEPDDGTRDSFKNLRVLWTRAILNESGRIKDSVAIKLLPKSSRWVVKLVPQSLLGSSLDWIVQRTNFLDAQIDLFLGETAMYDQRRQIILLGAGYDTRALRYLEEQPDVDFYEVDLPDISRAKARMLEIFFENKSPSSIHQVPFDLNEVMTKNKSLMDALVAAGMDRNTENLPTMVVCEAVLFYLAPVTVQKVLNELFEINATRYALTDNLSKVGVTPGGPESPRNKCETWLSRNGKILTDHDAIWGGAIHFVGARGE